MRISAVISFLSGLIIVISVLYPILSYQIENPPPLISPLREGKTLKASTWFEDNKNLRILRPQKLSRIHYLYPNWE